jgi:HSP20 family protein
MLQRVSDRNFPVPRFFDNEVFMPGSLLRGFFGEEYPERGWMPPVDVKETESDYLVTAELPGLTKKDVEITLDNNVLTLTGERRVEKETKGETYHRSERSYGKFSRSFALPREVDGESVKAAFKDGLLTLSIPKRAEARSRRIEIS